jgi:hypothetical protein
MGGAGGKVTLQLGNRGSGMHTCKRIGAKWPILSPNQAISSLNREQNNPIMLIMLMPIDDANGLKMYTYAIR